MLKDVVIHLHNEQPLMADLPRQPSSGDNCLICTNLRTMSGKTPVFADMSDSTFLIPMAHVRFIEVRNGSGQAVPADGSSEEARLEDGTGGSRSAEAAKAAAELQANDFVRRVHEA